MQETIRTSRPKEAKNNCPGNGDNHSPSNIGADKSKAVRNSSNTKTVTYWNWGIENATHGYYSDEMMIYKMSIYKNYGIMEIDPNSIEINFVRNDNNMEKVVPQEIKIKADGAFYLIECYFLNSTIDEIADKDDENFANLALVLTGVVRNIFDNDQTSYLQLYLNNEWIYKSSIACDIEDMRSYYYQQAQTRSERSVSVAFYQDWTISPYEIIGADFYDSNTGVSIPYVLREKDYEGQAYYNHGNYSELELFFPEEIELPTPNSSNAVEIVVRHTKIKVRHKETGEITEINSNKSIRLWINGLMTIPKDKDFENYVWQEVATISNSSNAFLSQIVCHDGIFYMFEDHFGRCFRYDAKNEKIIKTEIEFMPNPCLFPQATAWENKIYVIGGRDSYSGLYRNDVQIYDINTDTWSFGAPIPAENGLAYTQAIVHEGRIYIWSGDNNYGSLECKMYVYDIKNNSWTTLETPNASSNYAATLIGDDIYYTDGYDGEWYYTSTVSIYNIPTNTWRYEDGLSYCDEAVSPGSGVINGKLVQTGGRWGEYYGETFSYNLETKEWSKLPAPTNDTMYSPIACTYNNELYIFSNDNSGRLMKLTNTPSSKEPDNDYGYNTFAKPNKNLSYNATAWQDGDVITAPLLNKIENQLEALTERFL